MKNSVYAFVIVSSVSLYYADAATPNFSANIRTGVTSGTPTQTLDIAGLDAPSGTAIWFVADKSGNGLGIGSEGSIVTQDVINSWSVAGDNRVIRFDSVPGSLTPSNVGRFQRLNTPIDSVGLDLNFNDQRALGNPGPFPTKVWAVLWDDSTGGDVGDTFAIGEVTNLTIPNTLNPNWVIQPINLAFAAGVSDYMVVAVPEPSTYALMALGGLGAFACRRFRRA